MIWSRQRGRKHYLNEGSGIGLGMWVPIVLDVGQGLDQYGRIHDDGHYADRLGLVKRIGDAMPRKTYGTKSSTKPMKNDAAERAGAKPVLLSGGNPQIAKADGDAPVQAYIAAMPGWKSELGRRLDELIVRTVPDVRKAVRWNSPWYGIEGQGWFVSYHVFTRYVKVTFLNGASLRPLPPGSGKDPDARWIDIYEGTLDEEQMAAWVRQSAALPGWRGF